MGSELFQQGESVITIKDLRDVPTGLVIAWLGAISSNLRQGDLDEITATTELDPLSCLTASVMVSDMCWIIFDGNIPITVFGCSPSGCENSGIVWMMGTPRMDEVALRLGRISHHCLNLMHERYACLWNYIDARNEKSMRWLSWTGFEIIDIHPEHGREQRPFFTFARLQHV
jgi:hypothetical protein